MRRIKLDDLVGNTQLKKQLRITHGASLLTNRAMPHMLFDGLPGTGKTSTSKGLADLGNYNFIEANAEEFKTPESIAEILMKFSSEGYDSSGNIIGKINPSILFIDEAHRLSLKAEEMLGIIMENWTHTFSIKKGKKTSSLTIWVPRFTLVCATTKSGDMSKPFRDRFKLTYIFGEYSKEECEQIVIMHASKKGVSISTEAVSAIAKRSRGTARLIVRYLDRAIEAMLVYGSTTITEEIVNNQFVLMGIDCEGLTNPDIILLKTLYESDEAVGLETLALKINQDSKTIKEVNEPYLIIKGFIQRGKRGRVITDKGIEHLKSQGVISEKENTNSFCFTNRGI